MTKNRCPDGFYRGCDFMGCVGLDWDSPNRPECPHKIVPRPSWDEYYLAGARWVASRADCRRAQHGCIIVDSSNRVVSMGYNGSPAGGASCLRGECPRGLLTQEECASLTSYENCIASHAEMNAVANGDSARMRGGTAYITGQPCNWCSKLMVAAGIERVVF